MIKLSIQFEDKLVDELMYQLSNHPDKIMEQLWNQLETRLEWEFK